MISLKESPFAATSVSKLPNIESQISDSPVWTRIGESLKTFVLLDIESSSSRAGAGDVLLGRDDEHENVSYEFKEDCHMNYDQNDLNRQSNNIQDQVGATEINEYKTTDSSQNSLQEKNSTCNDKDSPQTASWLPSSASTNGKKHESNAGKRQFTSKKEGRQDIRKESLSRETIVQSVQVVFQEWCTHSTMEYLGLTEKTESVFPDTEADPDSFIARAARFFHPAINVKDDSDSDPETEATSKITKEDVIIKERKGLDKNPVCILPPIDSKSQTTTRRRIVLEKLFRTFPDLLSEVKLTVGEISRDLTQLVHTFSLSSKNVAMKPLQWKILALALIVILQQKNHLVSQAMESSSSEFDALLDRLAITRQDIDQVLSPLSSFKPLEHNENLEQAAKTLESSEKQENVFEERKDYGDMEELD